MPTSKTLSDMKKHTVFKNAPIKEALLDIRTNLPSETNLAVLSTFYEEIKDRFPKRDERQSFQGGFQIKAGSAPEILGPSGGTDGYLFRSLDETKIVQARLDGFTFNKLKPYDRWESFSSEAKTLWEMYIKIAKPKTITRLALRYINRIELPLPLKQFKDFILTVPDIAEGVPDGLAKFFMQLIIPDRERKNVAVITETMEPAEKGVLPFIFDIDVYREVALAPTDSEIWNIFEGLRIYKNQIFLESITSKCEDLFQ